MFAMPADVRLPDAAALYFPFHLAWLGLFERGDLKAGETVLIHAAAGGAGSAANRGGDVVYDNVGPGVFDQSLKCTAYNGRYVMMGFAGGKTKADEPFIVPRRVLAGNHKLCGVLLSYAAPEMAGLVTLKAVHPVMGGSRRSRRSRRPSPRWDTGERRGGSSLPSEPNEVSSVTGLGRTVAKRPGQHRWGQPDSRRGGLR